MNSNRKHGGTRKGAGRKVRLNLHFEYKDAHTIHVLTQHQRLALGRPDLSEEQVINELAKAAWQEIEQDVEEAAEIQAPYIV